MLDAFPYSIGPFCVNEISAFAEEMGALWKQVISRKFEIEEGVVVYPRSG